MGAVVAAMGYLGQVFGPEVLLVAQAGTLFGLAGLHALQGRRYHPVGSVGHKAAALGAVLPMVRVLADGFAEQRYELVAYVLILGLGFAIVGLVLSGIAIVVAPVALRWVGWLLIAAPLAYFPLFAVAGGLGGPVLISVAWLSVAVALLSNGVAHRTSGTARESG